ncbi:MAG: hypothetical protein JW786_01595 [Desulfobacterales bacterium]|nr:hypothetical protein [Desulfobacterales bacterium]
MIDKTTTPNQVTFEIVEFCVEIDSSRNPIFVPVAPSQQVRFNYCLTDVPLFVKSHRGKTQFGWIIWECPHLYFEAEFHACWVNPENKLVDITPKPDNEKHILFLPDSKRVYEHKPVPNFRRILFDNDYTRLWLTLQKKKDETILKHFKNDEVDSIAAEKEFNEWIKSIRNKIKRKK